MRMPISEHSEYWIFNKSLLIWLVKSGNSFCFNSQWDDVLIGYFSPFHGLSIFLICFSKDRLNYAAVINNSPHICGLLSQNENSHSCCLWVFSLCHPIRSSGRGRCFFDSHDKGKRPSGSHSHSWLLCHLYSHLIG